MSILFIVVVDVVSLPSTPPSLIIFIPSFSWFFFSFILFFVFVFFCFCFWFCFHILVLIYFWTSLMLNNEPVLCSVLQSVRIFWRDRKITALWWRKRAISSWAASTKMWLLKSPSSCASSTHWTSTRTNWNEPKRTYLQMMVSFVLNAIDCLQLLPATTFNCLLDDDCWSIWNPVQFQMADVLVVLIFQTIPGWMLTQRRWSTSSKTNSEGWIWRRTPRRLFRSWIHSWTSRPTSRVCPRRPHSRHPRSARHRGKRRSCSIRPVAEYRHCRTAPTYRRSLVKLASMPTPSTPPCKAYLVQRLGAIQIIRSPFSQWLTQSSFLSIIHMVVDNQTFGFIATSSSDAVLALDGSINISKHQLSMN